MSLVTSANTPAAKATASTRMSRSASRHGRLARSMPSSSQMLPVMTRATKPTPCSPRSVRPPSSRIRRVTACASGAASAVGARSPSMCPTRRTIVSAVRLRTETGPSAGMDRTATPWVALTWAITGRRAVCSGRSVTHTARCQPRSRSILRPAAISALRSVGGSTSRSETNLTRHRTPGSCPASRSMTSPARLPVSSDAGPGEASRPMTSSGCREISAPLCEPGPSATIPLTTTEVMFATPAHPDCLELSPRYAFESGAHGVWAAWTKKNGGRSAAGGRPTPASPNSSPTSPSAYPVRLRGDRQVALHGGDPGSSG
jgi:hypothetical protein